MLYEELKFKNKSYLLKQAIMKNKSKHIKPKSIFN